MLKLVDITKHYEGLDVTVKALKGINIEFRKNEFVAILGPSGCGKTTLLNIIGGLDSYTSGDLIIDGVSTKEYKSSDWDRYRNHSIGFVFQTYNLIPHQTVLANVELALTISGESKSSRRIKAIKALEKVGLKDQLKKKPNQMSGGQMQRVAIARALVNDPDILLADEPTGALDTETSLQIMELLKEVAKDRLVIMVTHNPDLANTYANRIVKLLDGEVLDDTNPCTIAEKVEDNKKKIKEKKPSMSFWTALTLSFNNLLTKKARTILTAFAGSIGIIGIALILSLQSGAENYIAKIEEDTLSSYPISIESQMVDMNSLMNEMMGNNDIPDGEERNDGYIYESSIMTDMIKIMTSQSKKNDLASFKKYLESDESTINNYTNAIKYGYDLSLQIYASDQSQGIIQVNPSSLMNSFSTSGSSYGVATNNFKVFNEMLDNDELVHSQYDVLYGAWPSNYNELVIVVDENNEIADFTLYALGLKSQEEIKKMMQAMMTGETYEATGDKQVYTYDEIMATKFKVVLQPDYYQKQDDGTWKDMRKDDLYMTTILAKALELKIVGIVRPNKDSLSSSIGSTIGYTSDLTKYIVGEINDTQIVKEQIANPDTDIIQGVPFVIEKHEYTIEEINAYVDSLPLNERLQVKAMMAAIGDEKQIVEFFNKQMNQESDSTYEDNLTLLGVVDLDKPSKINLYPKSMDDKDAITNEINNYNQKMTNEGKEEYVISYNDVVGIMMEFVTKVINTISYVLIAFVAISLVVSSIMIGVITYISVLERTKEIGILRSIGASKHNVSTVFNAETIIIGLVSGLMGIILTILLCIPANLIIGHFTGVYTLAALPVLGGVILVVLSIVLTVVAGLIPSRLAAKKNPVVALRSE